MNTNDIRFLNTVFFSGKLPVISFVIEWEFSPVQFLFRFRLPVSTSGLHKEGTGGRNGHS